jgi:hypothetical protein
MAETIKMSVKYSSKFYSRSLTLLIPILELINGGYIYGIYLKQYDRDKRLARIVDSPFHYADGNEASFVISRQGVLDSWDHPA